MGYIRYATKDVRRKQRMLYEIKALRNMLKFAYRPFPVKCIRNARDLIGVNLICSRPQALVRVFNYVCFGMVANVLLKLDRSVFHEYREITKIIDVQFHQVVEKFEQYEIDNAIAEELDIIDFTRWHLPRMLNVFWEDYGCNYCHDMRYHFSRRPIDALSCECVDNLIQILTIKAEFI
jgi:hypothetical protein